MPKPQIQLDPTGFPMIWVEEIEAYIHWLPVTKIQFEYFLCSAPDSRFDAAWYDKLLQVNERVSPSEIRTGNYWGAFLTGIKPSEAERFARWCGQGYELPSQEQWFSSYNSTKRLAPIALEALDSAGPIRERCSRLLKQLDAVSRGEVPKVLGEQRTRADQMFFRMGVMEWVDTKGQRSRWGGMGQTNPTFHGSLFVPDHGRADLPIDPEKDDRLPHYGFRLICRSE